MTFEEWDAKTWKVTRRDNEHIILKAPGVDYMFNQHDFLQLFRNMEFVAENIYEKEVYYIHDGDVFNRETGEQLLGVIDDCEKLNEQHKKIKGLERMLDSLNDKCENYRQALLDLGINVDILDGKVE